MLLTLRLNKYLQRIGLVFGLFAAMLLAACGGGGSGTGGGQGPGPSPAPVALSPDAVTRSEGEAARFVISGGVPPFSVVTSSPGILPNPTKIERDGSFIITPIATPSNEHTFTVSVRDGFGLVDTSEFTVRGQAGPSRVAAFPATAVAYYNVPIAFTIVGGAPPYSAFSSNSAVLPVTRTVSGSSFVVTPNNVSENTEVSIQIVDAAGQPTTVTVNVRPAPMLNVNGVTIRPTVVSGCTGVTVCSGQTATAEVTLRSPAGGALAGRAVRYEVVQGEFQFFTNIPNTPFASSLVVNTDQNGLAIVRLQALVNARTQAAVLKATDVATGQSVYGSFTITQVTDGSGVLSVVPEATTWTAYYSGECPAGAITDHYIFGGTPPYRVATTAPDILRVGASASTVGSQYIVSDNGGKFTSALSGCGTAIPITITDATGRSIRATITGSQGSNTRPTPIVVPFTVQPTQATLSCGQSGNFNVLGGTGIYSVQVNNSSLVTAAVVGNVVTITRPNTGGAGTGTVSVVVSVSDGQATPQNITVTVPAACPSGATSPLTVAPATATMSCSQTASFAISGGTGTYQLAPDVISGGVFFDRRLTVSVTNNLLVVTRVNSNPAGSSAGTSVAIPIIDSQGSRGTTTLTIPETCPQGTASAVTFNPSSGTLACSQSADFLISGGSGTGYVVDPGQLSGGVFFDTRVTTTFVAPSVLRVTRLNTNPTGSGTGTTLGVRVLDSQGAAGTLNLTIPASCPTSIGPTPVVVQPFSGTIGCGQTGTALISGGTPPYTAINDRSTNVTSTTVFSSGQWFLQITRGGGTIDPATTSPSSTFVVNYTVRDSSSPLLTAVGPVTVSNICP